jgi:UDP-N-acetylglucosamine 2-epimerase
VLDAVADRTAIGNAIGIARSAEFRARLAGMANPFGEGRASEKIVEVLTSVPLGKELLVKRHPPLPFPSETLSKTVAP